MQGIMAGSAAKAPMAVLRGAGSRDCLRHAEMGSIPRGGSAPSCDAMVANVVEEIHRESRTASDVAELLAFSGWASYDFRLVLHT